MRGNMGFRAAAGRLVPLALGALALGGCATSVDYGKIPHTQFVADPRCQTGAGDTPVEAATMPLFFVTSRLPDCRTAAVALTNHRGDRVRHGRFAPPQPGAKGEAAAARLAFMGDAAWWDALKGEANLRKGRVLLYVHGYRESFDTTARDTGQIARMTGFDGPVISYSWPSQAKLLSYAVDETNMYWDERNFRTFLTKLAREPWVKEIVIVSHSLGARLVIPAIEYVDRTSSSADSSNISNIILASPDVDREDFERDIAEEVLAARRVNNDRRITVYASASDKALALSRTLHGYPRLGSPYCFNPFEAADLKRQGLPNRCYPSKTRYDVDPAKSGFTVIDTTDVSRGSTGHSDFLNSAPACADFIAVVNNARSRPERVATHLAHVFRLAFAPDAKAAKAADKAVCRMDRD